MAVDLIATIPAREHTVARVRELLDAYAAHCLAMDGTERFEVYLDRDLPHHVVVIERYRDETAFAAHLADPENGVLNGALADLTDGGSTLRFLTA
ncbi:putative quinol monooxygenase [Microbacterium sp.]|uniref:putative quinol monooxygenase n=1 Tax=Microbacterium sp. TaxID=51671 RepID=UPI0039E6407D